eukprot:TRINITY_DN17051_c0_g1_i1.p1 TRINITY_DN17051_c0_g1~~TRINITY_DN17051_c0_g1_i1.p1  ORF type:complete len:724 (+),score=140.23 TRINITY_DN17051_c0_g1_i1:104-2173(+)
MPRVGGKQGVKRPPFGKRRSDSSSSPVQQSGPATDPAAAASGAGTRPRNAAPQALPSGLSFPLLWKAVYNDICLPANMIFHNIPPPGDDFWGAWKRPRRAPLTLTSDMLQGIPKKQRPPSPAKQPAAGAAKPPAAMAPAAPVQPLPSFFDQLPSGVPRPDPTNWRWMCKHCNSMNAPGLRECPACRTPAPPCSTATGPQEARAFVTFHVPEGEQPSPAVADAIARAPQLLSGFSETATAEELQEKVNSLFGGMATVTVPPPAGSQPAGPQLQYAPAGAPPKAMQELLQQLPQFLQAQAGRGGPAAGPQPPPRSGPTAGSQPPTRSSAPAGPQPPPGGAAPPAAAAAQSPPASSPGAAERQRILTALLEQAAGAQAGADSDRTRATLGDDDLEAMLEETVEETLAPFQEVPGPTGPLARASSAAAPTAERSPLASPAPPIEDCYDGAETVRGLDSETGGTSYVVPSETGGKKHKLPSTGGTSYCTGYGPDSYFPGAYYGDIPAEYASGVWRSGSSSPEEGCRPVEPPGPPRPCLECGEPLSSGRCCRSKAVRCPVGDPIDHSVVMNALWQRKQTILHAAGDPHYLVVTWRRTDSRGMHCAGDQDQDFGVGSHAKLTAEDGKVRLSAECTLFIEPPTGNTEFAETLRRAWETVDHSQRIPVVIVDPCVRRSVHYTYMVVPRYPWLTQERPR